MMPHAEEYRTIPLSQGQEAVVTLVDFERFGAFNWYAIKKKSGFYAVRNHPQVNKKRSPLIYLHREILGLRAGDKRKSDHINHDTLNNIHTDDPKTNNLRIATHGQNSQNSRLRCDNASGFKGVYFDRRVGKWWSAIVAEGKDKWLGYFSSAELAYSAYCKASCELHGEFSCVK